ncbi:MAG: peptide chain release factor N(5)-glutamine methyltransferase [Candidatus Brocadia sp.]|jgi:protein-(glutamine-N5) methyltransferase, release factor-specific|uniref:Release factor glutamine methyltransferase n=1 Tax=Candidatus Brocadia fulgida TaxID=380242 RepID=A0A0M2UQD9_9BACT|nr:MAG: methyltransferase [Candidatus Brocadia fulgida]MBV6518351.1 Release factor glutamine methyltransferase [Candidatus Brocadia fulgida]MCE7910168.1 peptide chain release factor N(5)-glutamine methyltransferase [Candidatus Brocadia sp. AMX3]MDG5996171.1 peptide chain release factor N(5)-glutamine methyltransferase [Candidatus Brocadia sp.]RIK03454.1 MAG: peptide chain release factor N(5)-glutamine methyltransferase [Candidatus Brocadia sp.]
MKMPSEVFGANASQRDSEQHRNCRAAFSIPHDDPTIASLKNESSGKLTVSGLIRLASRELDARKIDTPLLDAEVILAHLLGCRRIDLYLHPDKPVETDVSTAYQNAIRRRGHNVPVSYITRHAEFMSLDFYVDERVLIPRPETELLVEAVIEKSQNMSCKDEIILVDIGAGSGAIAITLAKKIDKARIFAVDISADALSVARMNAGRHGVLHKITFVCGDTFEPLTAYGLESKVHFIVSNPPYVSSGEFRHLPKEVRDYEPYVALVSGPDGLRMFKRIITHVKAWLRPSGFLLFEVGEKQAQTVLQFLEDTGWFNKTAFIKDYQNINRIVVAQREK